MNIHVEHGVGSDAVVRKIYIWDLDLAFSGNMSSVKSCLNPFVGLTSVSMVNNCQIKRPEAKDKETCPDN